jgi:hypothetical protein
MKPHEQTWHVVRAGAAYDITDAWSRGAGPSYTFSPDPDANGWETDAGAWGYGLPRDVATLAAAAPDLVRALLAVEWGDGTRCPSCGTKSGLSCTYEECDGVHTHATNCELDAALRKAGVR